MLESARQPILENLAVVRIGRPRGLPEAARRDAGGAMKRAYEIRQVGKADIQCDIADRPIVRRQRPRGAAEPRPHEVLMRRHTDDAGEQAQEMKRTQAGLPRCPLEVDRLVCIRVEPHRGLDRTPAIA
jgi:hypothetical protein